MNEYILTPREEIYERLGKLRERVREAGLGAAVVIQNADLFYFTGSMQQGLLVVPADGDPAYFVRRAFERAVGESCVASIVKIGGPNDVLSYYEKRGVSFGKVGFELDVLPVTSLERFRRIFPCAEIMDISIPIREIRSVKSPFETDILKNCGKKLAALLDSAREKIHPGLTEMSLQGILQGEAISMGHTGAATMRAFNQNVGIGHIISGEDSAAPSFSDTPTAGKGLCPYAPSGHGYRAMQKNEPIIIDLVWSQGGCLVDMTRTYSIGKLPQKLEEAHQLSMEALRAIEAMIRPGAVAGDLYESGVAVAKRAGLAANFMGPPGYNVKFIGHGVGIELDEMPFIAKGVRTVLAPGMTFTLEPKFVFEGEGAVGIENTYLVTKDGFETLTPLSEDIIRCGE